MACNWKMIQPLSCQANVTSSLLQAGQRPFFTPQMQQVRPRWQPMQPQQQVRPSPGGMPTAGQVPRARGIRQVPPRGVPGQQQQPGGAGGPGQRVGGMGQPQQVPQQVRGPGGMQGQRPTYKFQQNVRNQPQAHPGAVSMQPQEQVQQAIHIPVSKSALLCSKVFWLTL